MSLPIFTMCANKYGGRDLFFRKKIKQHLTQSWWALYGLNSIFTYCTVLCFSSRWFCYGFGISPTVLLCCTRSVLPRSAPCATSNYDDSFYNSLSANQTNLVRMIWLARTSSTTIPQGNECKRWSLIQILALLIQKWCNMQSINQINKPVFYLYCTTLQNIVLDISWIDHWKGILFWFAVPSTNSDKHHFSFL